VNLLSTKDEKAEQSRHWVMLDAYQSTPDQQALRQLAQRLDMALDELGHIDYQLFATLAKLRCDLTIETHDNLNSQVSQLVEPGVRQAMQALADELNKAKLLTEEVLADHVNIKRS